MTDQRNQLHWAVVRDLGDPKDWITPRLYRNDLALAVVDSIFSIGVRYTTVSKVIDRYRNYASRKPSSSTDSIHDLLRSFDHLDGPRNWAREIGTRNRTSTSKGAPLKAEVVHDVAQILSDLSTPRAQDLRTASAQTWSDLEASWKRQPGQRSGISWRYFTALLGIDEIKPDRMIKRYIATNAPEIQGNAAMAQALQALAADFGVPVFTLDHNLWRFQSGRAPRVVRND